jgi:hypothetical protein
MASWFDGLRDPDGFTSVDVRPAPVLHSVWGKEAAMSLKQGLSYAGVLVVGMAGGWIAGLLTAPASGEETRRRLSLKLDEGKSRVRREAQRVVERTAAGLEQGIAAGRQKVEQALSRSERPLSS